MGNQGREGELLIYNGIRSQHVNGEGKGAKVFRMSNGRA